MLLQAIKRLSIRFWFFRISVCLGVCQSPHSSTAGERYSLFQLTAGLSAATGEHAGKWVTVNTVCLPHICSTGTMSSHRKCMTPRQRTKETVSKCATVKYNCSCFAHAFEVQRDHTCATSPLSCFPLMDCSSSEWKHFWWSRGWRGRPSGGWFPSKVNTRVMKRDWATLLVVIRAIFQDEKNDLD